MIERKFSERVLLALKVIETKELDQKSLRAFYENAMRFPGITDAEREAVVEALEKQIRTRAPRLANSLFGPKDAQARDLLRGIHDKLAAELDLSANTVGDGVKTGGDMVSGVSHVSVYISYKSTDLFHATFEWKQVKAESDPILVVRLYQTGPSASDSESRVEFPIEDLERAIVRYREHLIQLL